MDDQKPGPSSAITGRAPSPGRRVISEIVAVRRGSTSSSSSNNSGNHAEHRMRAEEREFNSLFDPEPKFHGLSRRQIQTLAVLALTDFVGAILLSNQNPWFPIQAAEQGISTTKYAIVFAIFEFSVWFFYPIFQNKMREDAISPNVLFHVGVFTSASSAILFAFLGYVSSSQLFLGLALVLRFIEGIGEAAFIAASFAIISVEFPESLTCTFVSLETFFGLGLLIGPPLGGALWDAIPGPERFTLTFGTFGFIFFLIAVLGLFALPRNNRGPEEKAFVAGFRMFAVLKVSLVPLCALTILASAFSVGFLFVTLSPHLAQFPMSPVLLGGIFLLNGGIAALTSPAFGWVVHRTRRPRLFIILGAALILTAFLLIGPAPFVPLKKTVWLICVGLIIHGLGLGAILASTFKFMLYQAVKYGYANNIATYTIVSSMWTSMFCLGTLIGTGVSGVLYDSIGFQTSAWVIIGLQAAVIILTVISQLTSQLGYRPAPLPAWTFRSSERQPLLDTRSPFSFVHQKSMPQLKRVLSAPYMTLTMTQPEKPRRSSITTYGSTEPSNSSVATPAVVPTSSVATTDAQVAPVNVDVTAQVVSPPPSIASVATPAPVSASDTDI